MSDDHSSNIIPVPVLPDGWLQVIAAPRSVSDGRRDRAAFERYFNPTTGATLALYWFDNAQSLGEPREYPPVWTWRVECDGRREDAADFERRPPDFHWADAVLIEWSMRDEPPPSAGPPAMPPVLDLNEQQHKPRGDGFAGSSCD